jgi:hypothetical protein
MKKENICAPALAFVFAWHRTGATGFLHSLRDHGSGRLKTELVDDLTRGLWIAHAHDRPSNRFSSVWRNESLPQDLLHRFSFCELINQLV